VTELPQNQHRRSPGAGETHTRNSSVLAGGIILRSILKLCS
jgi:hypothetical protein